MMGLVQYTIVPNLAILRGGRDWTLGEAVYLQLRSAVRTSKLESR